MNFGEGLSSAMIKNIVASEILRLINSGDIQAGLRSCDSKCGTYIGKNTKVATCTEMQEAIKNALDSTQPKQEPIRKTFEIEALADNLSTTKIVIPFGVDPFLGWTINVVGYAGQITHAQLDAYGDVEVIAHNNTNTFLPTATVTVTLAKS